MPPLARSRSCHAYLGSLVLFLCGLLVQLPITGLAAKEQPPEEHRAPTFSVQWDHLEEHADSITAPLDNGEAATLTLNPELQRAAHRLLRRAYPDSGAVALIDERSGKLLALSHFSRKGKSTPERLFEARYPAASVFKLITTAALLERTRVVPNTRVCVQGGEHGIERRHLEPPHGGKVECMVFSRALGFSVNAAYAQLATQYLLRQDLVDFGAKFGLNEPLHADVAGRIGKLEVPYNDLAFARTAAGFVGSRLSVLGAAHLAYVVASGGRIPQMQLIERAGEYRARDHVQYLGRAIKKSTAWRMTRMMEVTVHSGTSLDAFSNRYGVSYLSDIRVAGKTGTLRLSPKKPMTSWFVGFAPSRKPRVIVAALLQNGKVWREKANEVARDMLREYFKKHRGVSSPFDD